VRRELDVAMASSRQHRKLHARVAVVTALAILTAGVGAGGAAATAPTVPQALSAASQQTAASQPGPERRGTHVPDQGRTSRRRHREPREPGEPSIQRSSGRATTTTITPAAREQLPSTGADLLLFLLFAGLLLVAGVALRVAIADA
jgi:LPXTG cell wall anchor motif